MQSRKGLGAGAQGVGEWRVKVGGWGSSGGREAGSWSCSAHMHWARQWGPANCRLLSGCCPKDPGQGIGTDTAGLGVSGKTHCGWDPEPGSKQQRCEAPRPTPPEPLARRALPEDHRVPVNTRPLTGAAGGSKLGSSVKLHPVCHLCENYPRPLLSLDGSPIAPLLHGFWCFAWSCPVTPHKSIGSCTPGGMGRPRAGEGSGPALGKYGKRAAELAPVC